MEAATSLNRLTDALAGRYIIEREVGAGGMAIVYAAHDVRHDRRVALKVLRPELAAVIGAERFLAEIRTTAALQHPGILPLFDSGEADGQLYYVMPFVDGESLRARLDRERQLPVADAIRIATDVGEALAYAHRHGVIHRDVKPENILLQSGRPIIADFGIALAVQQAGGNRLTQTGLSLGTPQYMSPEQAAGERNMDGRADQYALAVIVYEMLAGEPPFTAPNTQALIARLMTEMPRPLAMLRRSVPEHVSATVQRGLEKLPADRFSTTEEFVRALAGGSATSTAAHVPVPSLPGRRWILAAAALLVVGLIAGAAIDRMTHRTSAAATSGAVIRFAVQPESGRVMRLVCCGNMIAISPDGRSIAYGGASPDGIAHIQLRALDSVETHELRETEDGHELFFSPDGTELGFLVGRRVRAIAVQRGTIRTIGDLPAKGFTGGGTWTSDGHIIYAVGNALYRAPASGGTFERFFQVDSAKGDLQIGSPHYVSGANSVLFGVQLVTGEPQVRELWLSSGKTRTIAPGVAPSFASESGWLVAARTNGALEARRFDPASGDTLGPARRIVDGIILRSPVFLYAEYALAPNGTLVTARDARALEEYTSELHLVSSDGHDEVHRLPFNAFVGSNPRFSPDGSRVLMVGADVRRRMSSTMVYDPARRAVTRLSTGTHVTAANWNARGDSVLVATSVPDVRVQAISESSQQRIIAGLQGWDNVGTLQATPTGIVFDGQRGTSSDIGLLDASHHVQALLSTPATENAPHVSPDQKRVAFIVADGPRSSVQVASFPSFSDRAIIEEGATNPRWTRDGRLAYMDSARHVVVVALSSGGNTVVGPRRIAATIPRIGTRGWDIDPSGLRVAYSAVPNTQATTQLVVTLNALASK